MRQGRLTEAVEHPVGGSAGPPAGSRSAEQSGHVPADPQGVREGTGAIHGAAGLVPASEKYRANMATALGLMGRQEEALALLQQILPEDKAKYNAEVLRIAHENEARPVLGSEG